MMIGFPRAESRRWILSQAPSTDIKIYNGVAIFLKRPFTHRDGRLKTARRFRHEEDWPSQSPLAIDGSRAAQPLSFPARAATYGRYPRSTRSSESHLRFLRTKASWFKTAPRGDNTQTHDPVLRPSHIAAYSITERVAPAQHLHQGRQAITPP